MLARDFIPPQGVTPSLPLLGNDQCNIDFSLVVRDQIGEKDGGHFSQLARLCLYGNRFTRLMIYFAS